MNQQIQLLSQLLIQEKNLASNLLQLMVDEKDVLEENLPDKLTELTQTKSACLDQIEIVSRKRAELLLAVSTAPTTVARMKQFIAQQSPQLKSSLTKMVKELEDILEKCRHQNSVNGMVISMSQRNVQRNLNIIKGIDQGSMTYTEKGKTTSIGQNHRGLVV